MNKENRIELCFKVLSDYEKNIRQTLLENEINDEQADEILKDFKVKNDLIFSVNKEYKKGMKFLDFCKENRISEKLPEMMNFHNSLYKHQENAIKSILDGKCTVVSTGTGSGKTESFLIPILDYCIKNKDKKGVKTIIIYPMNALAGDQLRRIENAAQSSGITYAMLNGNTPYRRNIKEIEKGNVISREDIIETTPDIIVTNYVMMERVLTNPKFHSLFYSSENVFKYIVLDEIHTYNGNKALHIKYLLHRLRERIGTDVIQIACSATLSRNKSGERTDGYMCGEVDEFIKNMFNIKDENEYSYIEPVYVKLENTGFKVDDDEYTKLQGSKITNVIKAALFEQSQNFNELLQILSAHNIRVSEEKLKDYFNKVLRLNEKYPDTPILDFRIHLFLLEIGDTLRRCSKCGKYYSLPIEKCNDCGHIVFPVYKKDVNLLVGELKKDVIIDPMNKKDVSLKDFAEQNIVLLNFNSDKKYSNYEHMLNFTGYETGNNYIRLDICKDGVNQVFQIGDGHPDVINLKSSMPFGYKLMKQNLRGLDQENRKILAFIDNREKCGRSSTTFGDDFLNEFYYETIKFICKDCIKTVHEIRDEAKKLLEEQLPLCNWLDDNLSNIIIHEFDYWFRRYLKSESDVDKEKRKFVLKREEKLTSDAKAIADIGLKEAVYFRNALKEYGQIIRLQRSSFIYPKGLGFGKSENMNFISLSDKGRKYKEKIKELGQWRIKKAVEGLLSKKIFIEETVENSNNDEDENINFPNSIFYLNADEVNVILEQSEYYDFKDLARENLFFTGAHTSEVDKETRKENEDKFQKGTINLLFATPTLEMGIDIGNLSFVYMLGVPPVPSNYAQRAGRAGRRGDRFAGIITICSERSSHDWYYFYNPKEIIEGLINPPKFNVNNKNVLNKHINTILDPGHNKIFNHDMKVQFKNLCEHIFDCELNIDEHIRMMNERIQKSRNIKGDFYKKGVYPEYNFSREEVSMFDEKQQPLTTRELETAYKQINIEKSMFIGDKYYYVTPEDDNNTFISMDGCEVIDIRNLKCSDNEEYIGKDKEAIKKEYYINIEIDELKSKKKVRGPISIHLNNKMSMEFIASYINQFDSCNSLYGYQIRKDAIIFEFDASVISETQYVSFMALIHKAIKLEFGLDSSEMALVIESENEAIIVNGNSTLDENNREPKNKREKYYAILYDNNGNENIDMEVVFQKICNNEVVNAAYKLVSECNCDKPSGCYLCMKSYDTQWMYDKLDKYSAKNMAGYLMEKESLRPQISITRQEVYYETKIELRRRGNFILKVNDSEEELENMGKENETIMYGLYKKIKDIYEHEDVESILLTSNIDRLISGLNGTGNLNDCRESLNLFNFYKQAYKKFDIYIAKN